MTKRLFPEKKVIIKPHTKYPAFTLGLGLYIIHLHPTQSGVIIFYFKRALKTYKQKVISSSL